jgi:hypothetical protein
MPRLLLTLIFLSVLLLEGCLLDGHPQYQPYSIWGGLPAHGYEEYRIDTDTFLVTYKGYKNFHADPFHDKWLKGAQEYVLYRAAELTRSQGAERFLVLHRDDWNLIGFGKYRVPIVSPGASAVIRIMRSIPSSTENDLYEVNALLTSLPMKNRGLPPPQALPVFDEAAAQASDRSFRRWRSVQPVSSMPEKARWRIFLQLPETKVTRISIDTAELIMWDREALSLRDFLLKCVELAEAEGYGFFTLVDWMDEEHRGRIRSRWSEPYWEIWFEMRATVVLQHSATTETLKPVFRVQDIKPLLH